MRSSMARSPPSAPGSCVCGDDATPDAASVGLPAAMHALSILASGDDSGGGSSITLLLFLIIPVAMYFLMIRPQRKQIKDQNALQSAIDVGDEVVTNSGIYGFITGVDGDKFWLE